MKIEARLYWNRSVHAGSNLNDEGPLVMAAQHLLQRNPPKLLTAVRLKWSGNFPEI